MQQLLHIFKLLGTPSEDVWPGVTKLRDWHEFPQWHPQDLTKVFPKLCPAGIDLMQKMFEYDPAKRITVGCCSTAVGTSSIEGAFRVLLLPAPINFPVNNRHNDNAALPYAGQGGNEAPILRLA